MKVSEGRGSLQLELIELLVVSLHALGLMASILYSPIGLSLQDPEGKEILFLPPIILDDTITLLGGGTEVYRHYNLELGAIG